MADEACYAPDWQPVVLMPPYCTTPAEARRMVAALGETIASFTKRA